MIAGCASIRIAAARAFGYREDTSQTSTKCLSLAVMVDFLSWAA